MKIVINATITVPTTITYGKTSEIKKAQSPTLFPFFNVIYKFEQRVPESFGHFLTKTRI